MTQSDPAATGDLAIDTRTALLFPDEAPLTPDPGLRDARAVWTSTPDRPDGTVLIYLHGHNNYVTVDAAGNSRAPDWATDAAARAGVAGKPAAPLIYKLGKLTETRHGPLVLVPEVAVHATGSFWAREPAGQYADPTRLGRLIDGCQRRLAALRQPGANSTYLGMPTPLSRLRRICLSGHSGAGLPLEEAARSAAILPESGVPSDLYLFDCTYWSKVDGFVEFSARWGGSGRLQVGDRSSARMVCIYGAGTQTEAVADDLRRKVAAVLKIDAKALMQDHTATADESAIRRQLVPPGTGPAVIFLRTHVPHDSIPTLFIPALLATAA